MESATGMKALYIVSNAGYSEVITDILRAAGAKGATIMHARGEGTRHETFMGITLDHEREVIVSIVDDETAEKAMADIKEKAGWQTDVHGICYTTPVDRVVGMR